MMLQQRYAGNITTVNTYLPVFRYKCTVFHVWLFV